MINRFARDNFQEAMKVAARADFTKVDWAKFKFMTFDVPNHRGPYEERYNHLGKHSVLSLLTDPLPEANYFRERQCKYVEVAPNVICTGVAHLEELFQNIIDEGGEGIILRDPRSPYQEGRSSGYLKHKVGFGIAEG